MCVFCVEACLRSSVLARLCVVYKVSEDSFGPQCESGVHLNYAKLVPAYKLVKNTRTSAFQKHRRFFHVVFLTSVSPFFWDAEGNGRPSYRFCHHLNACLQLTSCTILKKTPYKNPDLFPGLGAENWSTGSGIGRPLMNIKLPQIIWGGGGVRVWMWDIHLSTLHVAIHLHVWEVTLFHSEQVHTFSIYPSVHPSIPQSTTLLLYAVILSDTPPPPPSWLASSSVACHGGCAPSKLIDSSFFQKDVAVYQCALRSPAAGGAWLAGRLLKTVIPPLMPPSWKFRIVSAKTPYAK